MILKAKRIMPALQLKLGTKFEILKSEQIAVPYKKRCSSNYRH